jgi:signal transduction histidine kinase
LDGIAHNLKTPIFSIAGAMEGLEDLIKEYQDSISDSTVTIEDHKDIAKDMRDWTDKISSYLSYMTDIITAIQMQTSGNNSTENDSFTIKSLIKYINILMRYELKQNLIDLKISNKVDDDKIIYGNINSLIQVLNNLISNAIQAYPQNEGNKIIELNIYQKDKNFYIEVRDYAGGIPDEVANKLFKEMITTKGKNGTGLGLFISASNIKAHFKGSLTFKTAQNVGTTFIIKIPVTY